MQLKLPIFPAALATLSRWGAEIRSKSFLTEDELTLDTWDPEPSALAPLTITGKVIIRARYKILGNFAIILTRFNVTTGGAPSTTIYLPLPSVLSLADTQHSGWGNWGVGGVAQSLVIDQTAQGVLSLHRGDALNWANGITYGLNVGAIFELV